MTYEETLHFLFTSIPAFERTGNSGYKPGLGTSIALDDHLGNPHRAYRTIHVGGTNGKGSTSHLLAAILIQCGYKVGLYTSPHLMDFRERIRVNGKMIPKQYVVDFVEKNRPFFEPFHPSFFELTSSMAFEYFKEQEVDFAIIEVGLGGRLDSTNIISPILSVITNISLDHTQFLGSTVEQIASEKAGIIKKDVPALIGEAGQPSVADVFKAKAAEVGTDLYFAEEMDELTSAELLLNGKWSLKTKNYQIIEDELGGIVQEKNARTVLSAVSLLKKQGINISIKAVREGFAHVTRLTGLMGRWQVLEQAPLLICDTGHNIGGWEYIRKQLEEKSKVYNRLHMVVGMVGDKDIDGVLELMPKNGIYYFTKAAIPRAMPAEAFAAKGISHGLNGLVYKSVKEATETAINNSDPDDLIFIGGSTFIVAEVLPLFLKEDDLI